MGHGNHKVLVKPHQLRRLAGAAAAPRRSQLLGSLCQQLQRLINLALHAQEGRRKVDKVHVMLQGPAGGTVQPDWHEESMQRVSGTVQAAQGTEETKMRGWRMELFATCQ